MKHLPDFAGYEADLSTLDRRTFAPVLALAAVSLPSRDIWLGKFPKRRYIWLPHVTLKPELTIAGALGSLLDRQLRIDLDQIVNLEPLRTPYQDPPIPSSRRKASPMPYYYPLRATLDAANDAIDPGCGIWGDWFPPESAPNVVGNIEHAPSHTRAHQAIIQLALDV